MHVGGGGEVLGGCQDVGLDLHHQLAWQPSDLTHVGLQGR